MASIAKALGDPVRLQLVDVLRKHAGKVCVCELVPLFDLSQPTASHRLKVLRDAGIVGSWIAAQRASGVSNDRVCDPSRPHQPRNASMSGASRSAKSRSDGCLPACCWAKQSSSRKLSR
jgi:hypothetical protein